MRCGVHKHPWIPVRMTLTLVPMVVAMVIHRYISVVHLDKLKNTVYVKECLHFKLLLLLLLLLLKALIRSVPHV